MSETKAHYLKRLIDTGNLARGLTEKRGRVLNSFVRLSIIDVTTHDPDWIEREGNNYKVDTARLPRDDDEQTVSEGHDRLPLSIDSLRSRMIWHAYASPFHP